MIREDSFNTFTSIILDMAKKYFGDSAEIKNVNKTKNNGIIYKGISIRIKESNIAPVIYLNDLYKYYLGGRDYEDVFDEFKSIYYSCKTPLKFEVSDFADFSKAKDNIIYRLINYRENEPMLKSVPHRRILDLAVIYCFISNSPDYGYASVKIDNEHMKMWDTDENSLFSAAKYNTPKKIKAKITDMQELIRREEHEFYDNSEMKNTMFVATNEISNFGATVMLYPGVLSGFSKRIDESFYIIPSSVHELILLPKSLNFDEKRLLDTISEVNKTELEFEDILSNNAYFYDKDSNEVLIVS